MVSPKVNRYTIEEYLVLENQAEYRSEYEQGEILAMSGGTVNHGLIGTNFISEVKIQIKEKDADCYVLGSDNRLFIEKADSFVYPDGMVICGDIQIADQDKHAVNNPVLIVEVLSAATEGYDRGDKFQKYRSLPSLSEYILIDQYKPVIDVFYREEAGDWKMITTSGLDEVVYLHTLDCAISLRDIYRGVHGLVTPLL